ncbi:MAG: outer membrane beta-barrel protein [Gammaproteobacteria bacterium]
MRKLLPALTFALGSALVGAAAQAADNGFYLGAGVVQSKLDNVGNDFNSGNLNDFKLDDTSYKLIAGFRPIDLFAVELNYTDLGSERKNAGGVQFSADGKAYAAYAVGFLPIPIIDVYAKAGLVRYETNASADGPLGFRFDTKGTKFGYGAGVQAHLGSLAGRLEYEKFDVDHTDGVELLTLGATWTFL